LKVVVVSQKSTGRFKTKPCGPSLDLTINPKAIFERKFAPKIPKWAGELANHLFIGGTLTEMF
jgi:hypothetical protein